MREEKITNGALENDKIKNINKISVKILLDTEGYLKAGDMVWSGRDIVKL